MTEPTPDPTPAPDDNDVADETGTDDTGAAPPEDLPLGGVDATYDGSDTGDESGDPGTAAPDDPHRAPVESGE